MVRKDNILNVLIQTEEKEKRFFAAWKRGVDLLGGHLFGPKTPPPAQHKDDLQPLRALIEREIVTMSGGEEQFISAMVSFYNPDWGESLARKIDCQKSFCGLTYNFDHEQAEILAELMVNYRAGRNPEQRAATLTSRPITGYP